MSPAPSAAAVIVAAGNSTRMSRGGVRKPWLELGGTTILEQTCRAFDAAATVCEIVLVAHEEDVESLQKLAAESSALAKVRGVVPGGAERADSVRIGARWCGFELDVICVHDAARPLIEPATIDATIERAHRDGAALVAIPLRDTVKVAEAGGARVERTLDRDKLYAAQTPQAFRAAEFRSVLDEAEADGFRPTDDAALWERYRGAVSIVEGSPANLKITTPDDLELAEALLASRARNVEAAR